MNKFYFFFVFSNPRNFTIELDVVMPSSDKFPILKNSKDGSDDKEKEWKVITHADRVACFPQVKLTMDSKNADGLFLFACPLI